MEITKDKITEIFCIIDDFCKEYDAEIEKRQYQNPMDASTESASGQ